MQESQNATHLTPGHTHPPLTISPLPLNRCCGIAVWSLECISAQALCQSHPPQWPRLVLQMGLISNLQRQKRNAHPPALNPRLLSGEKSLSLRSVLCKRRGIDNMFKTNSSHTRNAVASTANTQGGTRPNIRSKVLWTCGRTILYHTYLPPPYLLYFGKGHVSGG